MRYFLIVVMFTFLFPSLVHADAWWGEGYRKPDWVLRHGGTIIDYKITGERKKEERYKAIMYKNGEYVEAEFGTKATFDDAKNGTYHINVVRCDDRCSQSKKYKKHKGDKVLLSTTVAAHPGENIFLTFDVKNGRTQKSSIYKYFKPQAQKKKVAEVQYGLKRKDIVKLTKEDISILQKEQHEQYYSCTQDHRSYQLPIFDRAMSSRYMQCSHSIRLGLLPYTIACSAESSSQMVVK